MEIYAGENKVWEGLTPRSLGYVRLSLAPHAATDTYTIRLAGEATSKDLFETMKEIDPSNDSKEKVDGKRLGIIEVGFIICLNGQPVSYHPLVPPFGTSCRRPLLDYALR